MNNLAGAARPVFKRKVLWIAVAAVLLVLAWAKAGYPDPYAVGQSYFMGADGVLHTDGMMPPNKPYEPGMMPPDGLVVKQQSGKHVYTYVATNQNGVYLIKRNGVAWATVTLDKPSGLYVITDPNGTGQPLLKLGTPRRGSVKMDSGPTSTH